MLYNIFILIYLWLYYDISQLYIRMASIMRSEVILCTFKADCLDEPSQTDAHPTNVGADATPS